MRFVDINAPDVDRLQLSSPIDSVPTVLVVENGRERGRIAGYVGPEIFFHSLSRLLPGLPEQAPPPVPDHWGVHESRLLLVALRDGAHLTEIAEGLGSMGFRNPALEAFRRDLVDALTLERLDSGTIERHLTELGHGPTLERLRGSEARRGWACVGSESSPEEALFLWRHSQIAWQLDEIERETARAERNFSESEPSDPSMRLVQLAAERAELLRYREELDGELDALRQSGTGRL